MTDHRETDHEPRTDPHDDLDTDRPSGWAGVDDALGGTHNRPAGPDYGAKDTTDGDPGANADTTVPRTRTEDL